VFCTVIAVIAVAASPAQRSTVLIPPCIASPPPLSGRR